MIDARYSVWYSLGVAIFAYSRFLRRRQARRSTSHEGRNASFLSIALGEDGHQFLVKPLFKTRITLRNY